MSHTTRITVYESSLFRVEEQMMRGRLEPYSFVRRIGAATVLPVVKDAGGFVALTIDNNRLHYGEAKGILPCGNAEGRFNNPEAPGKTALRELKEETGYGYPEAAKPDIDMFLLREVSNTIDYPRYFGVARNVMYIGGEEDNRNEVITVRPTPLEQYVDELLQLDNDRIYPEVNIAFSRAGMHYGREAVLGWLTGDLEIPGAASVPQSFGRWMTPVPAPGPGTSI